MEEEYNKSNSTQWLFIGCILLILILICYGVALFTTMAWLESISKKAQVYIEAPKNITQDQTFVITMVIQNISDKDIHLDSIRIDADFHKRLDIKLISPPNLKLSKYDEFGINPIFQVYDFALIINPSKGLKVTFSGNSGVPKDLGGTIRICINSSYSCISDYISINVDASIEQNN